MRNTCDFHLPHAVLPSAVSMNRTMKKEPGLHELTDYIQTSGPCMVPHTTAQRGRQNGLPGSCLSETCTLGGGCRSQCVLHGLAGLQVHIYVPPAAFRRHWVLPRPAADLLEALWQD